MSSQSNQKMLNYYSVKFVIVPPADSSQNGELFKWFNSSRSDYIRLLNSQKWLKNVSENNGDYEVYENLKFSPRGVLSSKPMKTLTSTLLNSSLYVGKINDKNIREVRVSAAFDPGWKAYVVPASYLLSNCSDLISNRLSCKMTNGISLVAKSQLAHWASLKPRKGDGNSLFFSISSKDSKNIRSHHAPAAIVVVFGQLLILNLLMLVSYFLVCLMVLYALIAFRRTYRTNKNL